MTAARDPALFIGSSTEGLPIAENLHLVLDDYCEATVWNQGVFGLSDTTIEILEAEIGAYDFATLVLTPDDLLVSKRSNRKVARDNVIFEAGLFIGAIGRQRTFLVTCKEDDVDLPSDLRGITHASYRRRSNLRAALSPVGVEIRTAMERVGTREQAADSPTTVFYTGSSGPDLSRLSITEERELLEQELASLTTSAEAQGWTVKTHSASAYRLVAPDGLRFSLTLGDPRQTRRMLRPYAKEVNTYGLRVSRALLMPPNEV